MTIKAYSYLRISSHRQKKGGGIKRQMAASAKWAEDNGYELGRVDKRDSQRTVGVIQASICYGDQLGTRFDD